MRTNRQEMETKEYRAPRVPEANVEPTPEMVARKRREAKENRDTKNP